MFGLHDVRKIVLYFSLFYATNTWAGLFVNEMSLSASQLYDDNINFVSSTSERVASNASVWHVKPMMGWENESTLLKLKSEYYLAADESEINEQTFWLVSSLWQQDTEHQQWSLQIDHRYDNRVERQEIDRLLTGFSYQEQASDNISLDVVQYHAEFLSTFVQLEYQKVNFDNALDAAERNYKKYHIQFGVDYQASYRSKLQFFTYSKQVRYQGSNVLSIALLDDTNLLVQAPDTDVIQYGLGVGVNHQISASVNVLLNMDSMVAQERTHSEEQDREGFGGTVQMSVLHGPRSQTVFDVKHRLQLGDFGWERETRLGVFYRYRLSREGRLSVSYYWSRVNDQGQSWDRLYQYRDALIHYEYQLNPSWTFACDLQYNRVEDQGSGLHADRRIVTTKMTFHW